MRKIVILTGPVRSGKTNTVKEAVKKLRKTVKTGGITEPKAYKRNSFIGYDIQEIATGKEFPFLRIEGNENQQRLGRFFVEAESISKGISAIEASLSSKLLVIDEIGPLELSGEGFAEALKTALERTADGVLLLVIRDTLIEKVIETFGIDSAKTVIVPPYMWKDLDDILQGRLL